MKKRSRIALAVLVSTTAFAAACSGDDDDSTGGSGAHGGGTAGKAAGGAAGKGGAGQSGGGGTAGSAAGSAGTAPTAGSAGASTAGSAGSSQAGSTTGGAGSSGAPTGGFAGGGTAGGGGVGAIAGMAQAGEGGEVGGAGGEAGSTEPPPPVLTGKHHLYVGCADGSGTLQSYLIDGSTISPLNTVVTGGAISNSTFNNDGDRLYVAYAISGGETRIATYTRDTTTGALSTLGTAVNVPMSAGAGGTGGQGGAGGRGGNGGGGAGGAGGAAPTTPGPQTLVLDAGEDYLAVPNYYAGSVYVYDVATNGSLGALLSSDAGGTNGHDVVFSNNNNFMIVPYLGSNYIKVYNFNDNNGNISLDGQTDMPEAMSGPRHIALHPNGTWLYSINETAGGASSERGTLDLFDFSQTSGALTPVHTYSVPLPSGYSGLKNGAEIVIAPSAQFLYVSMRLDNVATGSIVAYAIGTDGALSFVEQYSSGGITPRQFSLSSDGKLLVVGNQNSDNVRLFAVDTATGKLTSVTGRDVCDSPRFSRFADIAPTP